MSDSEPQPYVLSKSKLLAFITVRTIALWLQNITQRILVSYMNNKEEYWIYLYDNSCYVEAGRLSIMLLDKGTFETMLKLQKHLLTYLMINFKPKKKKFLLNVCSYL